MLDDAVIVFTKTFYQELLSGKRICESYRQAVASVKFREGSKEGDLFVLLTQDTQNEAGRLRKSGNSLSDILNTKHNCTSTIKIDSGSLQCISDHILLKQVPHKVPNFDYREKPIAELIQSVMEGERLVVLLGVQGLHKSAVARFAIHFMLERKNFTGGAIFVTLKNLKYFR